MVWGAASAGRAVNGGDPGRRGQARRLGAEDARTEPRRDQPAAQRRLAFLCREAALRPHREQEALGSDHGLAEPQRLLFGIEREPAPLRVVAQEREHRVPLPGRLDPRHVGAAALPGRLLRDALPAQPLRLAALLVEPDGRALAEKRYDPRRAQLGGLLHDEIHLLALGERLDQHHVEPACSRRQLLADVQRLALQRGAEARSAAVEDLQLRSVGEPQDLAQVVPLLLREREALGEQFRRDEEPLHRLISMRSQPSRSLRAISRSPCAAYALAAASPCEARSPERTSRPPGATVAAIRGASSSSVLRRMLAMTIPNCPRTPPASSASTHSTHATSFSSAPARAASRATGSFSVPTTRPAPSFAASSAITPLPVPRSRTSAPGISASSSSHRSRQSAVVGWLPVPNAIPGSIATATPWGGFSQGG